MSGSMTLKGVSPGGGVAQTQHDEADDAPGDEDEKYLGNDHPADEGPGRHRFIHDSALEMIGNFRRHLRGEYSRGDDTQTKENERQDDVSPAEFSWG
jgi:hypothetical protein